MQCGIKLLVKNNKVVGFEPWEEFPFNQGRLCPKGVQRYLQNNHPDRLMHPLERAEGIGFLRTSWESALSRTVSEIQRIQSKYGRDAFAMLSGVSLTNEKSYLVGKFARIALRTRNLDYNGRLCMVSAGAANKKAFGLDRGSNNYSDLAHAEVIMICGTNVSETFPYSHSLAMGCAQQRREARRGRSPPDSYRAHRRSAFADPARPRFRALRRDAAPTHQT
jgi:assimilatory nitrate reductase catalytic subunit